MSIFSNGDLDLIHRHLGSNPKLPLDITYSNTKFGVNRPKKTQVIELERNFYLRNSDLDLNHRHLDSNRKLPLGISYQHTKYGFNRSRQTYVIERKLIFYV